MPGIISITRNESNIDLAAISHQLRAHILREAQYALDDITYLEDCKRHFTKETFVAATRWEASSPQDKERIQLMVFGYCNLYEVFHYDLAQYLRHCRTNILEGYPVICAWIWGKRLQDSWTRASRFDMFDGRQDFREFWPEKHWDTLEDEAPPLKEEVLDLIAVLQSIPSNASRDSTFSDLSAIDERTETIDQRPKHQTSRGSQRSASSEFSFVDERFNAVNQHHNRESILVSQPRTDQEERQKRNKKKMGRLPKSLIGFRRGLSSLLRKRG